MIICCPLVIVIQSKHLYVISYPNIPVLLTVTKHALLVHNGPVQNYLPNIYVGHSDCIVAGYISLSWFGTSLLIIYKTLSAILTMTENVLLICHDSVHYYSPITQNTISIYNCDGVGPLNLSRFSTLLLTHYPKHYQPF